MSTHPTLHAEIVALLPRLRRFARCLACKRDDGDDLVQAALARALGPGERCPSGVPLDRWLFGIIKDGWLAGLRHGVHPLLRPGLRPLLRADARPAPVFAFEQEDGQGDRQGEGQGGNERRAPRRQRLLRQAMAQLAEEHRIVAALVLVDGLSYQGAADIVGIPVGTLISRLARARESLQGLLSQQARTVA